MTVKDGATSGDTARDDGQALIARGRGDAAVKRVSRERRSSVADTRPGVTEHQLALHERPGRNGVGYRRAFSWTFAHRLPAAPLRCRTSPLTVVFCDGGSYRAAGQ
jgi:hypothetical protein